MKSLCNKVWQTKNKGVFAMRKNNEVAVCDGHNVYEKLESTGRRRLYLYIGGCRVWLHHYLADRYIRPLKAGEIVHHKDINPFNDSVKNLEIVSRGQHIKIHKPVLGYKFTDEQKKRLSKSHIGQIAWNKGQRGFKHSEQSRTRMSNAQKGRLILWGDKIAKAKTKVTKEELLSFLSKNQKAALEDIMKEFGLKSSSPVQKCGGLRRLRKEAVV